MPDIGPRIGIDGEKEYRQQIQNIIQQQKTLNSEMKKAVAEFGNDANAKKKSAEQTRILNEQIENQQKRVDELNKMYQASVQKTGESSTATLKWKQALTDAETELINLQKQLQSPKGWETLSKNMKAAGASLQDLGSQLKGTGDTFLAKLSSTATKTSAGILGLGTAASLAAKEYESSFQKMLTISNTAGGEGSASVDDLRKSIKELSDQTGKSQKDIAEAAYQAISAGRSTAEAVGFVDEANKLSVAGFTDLTTSVDTLTTILNAYGMSADQTSKVSDALITTQNLGKTTVDELGQSMGKVIPTAAMFGVDLNNLSAAFVTTTKNGIGTAEATTYINGMLNELGKAGTIAADTLQEETGKSFSELMNSGMSLSDVLGILQNKASETGLTMADMFGSQEAGKAAATIIQHTNDFNSSLQTLNTTTGQTQTAFDQLMSSDPALQLQQVQTTLQNLGVTVGSTILPVVVPVLQEFAGTITSISNAFSQLDPQTQEFIVKAGMIAVAAGLALPVIGSIVGGIGSILSVGGSFVGWIGNVATGAGSAASNVAGLASSTGASVGPVASASASFGQLAGQALSLVALGGGIALASIGISQLADAAVKVTSAGPGAITVLGGIVLAVAGFAAGAAALGPALTAGSVGFVAFGAAVTLVGAGIGIATSGIADLSKELPTISKYGGDAAGAIVKLSGSVVAFSGSVVVAAAGAVSLAAGLTGLAAGMTAVSAASLVFNPAIEKMWKNFQNIEKYGDSAQDSIDDVRLSIDPLKRAFDSANSSVSDAMKKMSDKVDRSMDDIARKFSNTKLKFNQDIDIPHFSLKGSFNAKTGSVPKVSVSWYEKAYKNAVVFTRPTVLPTASGFKGFGDGTGNEVVVGENYLVRTIENAVRGSGSTGRSINVTINVDGGNYDEEELADLVSQKIQQQIDKESEVWA